MARPTNPRGKLVKTHSTLYPDQVEGVAKIAADLDRTPVEVQRTLIDEALAHRKAPRRWSLVELETILGEPSLSYRKLFDLVGPGGEK